MVPGGLGLPRGFELISVDLFGCLNLANLCGLQLTGLPWIPPGKAWICSCSLPTFLRHQFPSSSIGDDLNITWRQVSLYKRIFTVAGKDIVGISLYQQPWSRFFHRDLSWLTRINREFQTAFECYWISVNLEPMTFCFNEMSYTANLDLHVIYFQKKNKKTTQIPNHN